MRARARAIATAGLGLGLALAACSQQPDDLVAMTASPAHASLFGDLDVTITGDFARVGDVQSVTIGGVQALDVRPVAGGVTVHLQGAPASGAAEIVVTGAAGSVRNASAFTYDAPRPGVPASWVAFGASLTQGVQSGGIAPQAELMGYAAQIARAAGVFLALPLFKEGVVPPLEPSAFVGHCNASLDPGTIGNDLFSAIWDPSTSTLDLRQAREDATLSARDIAVGGSTLADVVDGPSGMPRILQHICDLPDGDPSSYTAPVAHPQLERLRLVDADVGFSADLLANDAIVAVDQGDDLHPEQMTPVATVKGYLDTIASTLGALHGQYFVATLLDLTLLPNVAVLQAKNLPDFDTKLAQVRATMAAYDQALSSAFAPYGNLHVVDLAPQAATIANGVTIAGVALDGHEFGGLLSLDQMHFTNTGYALLANVMIDAIDRQLGLAIPHVDVSAVEQHDPLSPPALAAAGVHCRM